MKSIAAFSSTLVLTFVVACGARDSGVVSSASKSRVSYSARAKCGTLKVYSAQGWGVVDEHSAYLHGDYQLVSSEGRLLRRVENAGPMNGPEAVALPPGGYIVIAQAKGRGRVEAPVTIEAGLVTELRLDKE